MDDLDFEQPPRKYFKRAAGSESLAMESRKVLKKRTLDSAIGSTQDHRSTHSSATGSAQISPPLPKVTEQIVSRKRDAAFAKEHFGLHVSVPYAAWGGKWTENTSFAVGMVVSYSDWTFTIQFPDDLETEPVYVHWAQLYGEAEWCSVLLELQLEPMTSFAGELTRLPGKRRPTTAACWDMRRAAWSIRGTMTTVRLPLMAARVHQACRLPRSLFTGPAVDRRDE